MTRALDARIEVARGELVIGERVIPMSVEGAADLWRVGGPAGPLLRSLGYGERTRLCALAAMSSEPRASLAAAVARAATVTAGELDVLVAQTAALLLCGASDEGPSFSDTVLRVGRAAGWDLLQLMDAQAADVDRLAAALGASAPDSGWNRLVFDTTDAATSLEAVRDRLADRLLARVDDAGVGGEGGGDEGATAFERQLEADASAPAAAAAFTRGALDGRSVSAPASPRSSDLPPPPFSSTGVTATLRPALVISNNWSSRALAPQLSALTAAAPADSMSAPVGEPRMRVPGSVAATDAALQTAASIAPAVRSDAAAASRASGGTVAALASGPQARIAGAASPARHDRLGLAVAHHPVVATAATESSRAASGTWPGRTGGLPLRPAAAPPTAAEPSLERTASELADHLASLLQDEADLRGIE